MKNAFSLENLKKMTVLHVISALLLPAFCLFASQKVSAQHLPLLITPPSAPPAGFIFSANASSNVFANLFGLNENTGINYKNRFSDILSIFKVPELPAGLETGRVPTLTERLSESLKTSPIFSKVVPLFSDESSSPKVKVAKTSNLKATKATLKANESFKESEELNRESLNEINKEPNQTINSESTESIAETEIATALLSSPVGGVRFDFDGDGKADQTRKKGSSSEWKIRNSSNGNVTTLSVGASTSILTPGDFDGDGKTDAAVFEAGTWTIKQSSNGQTVTASWGTSGDKPATGNYDGDSKSDFAVFRPSTNTWWIFQSSNGATVSASFGASGDILVPADYDGDNKTDIAVFRPSTGYWHVQGSSAGYFGLAWGLATDIPVPADFDGDGKTDITVYRGSTGSWYAHKSSTNNGSFLSQNWGNYGDQPVPADYDGDGKDDFAVFRPNTGVWHIIKSGNSQFEYQTLGQAGDLPVNAAYLKQISGTVHSYDLAKSRLSPRNATGDTNLYSQNFSWGTSLVGLAGRAGLDMGFGISYNSLVWTKYTDSSNNSSVFFDTDNSNVSPGFRFGFPTIEPIYWDKNAQTFNYLMVTPSGARVEFRQVNGASDTFETSDSSYLQLKTVGASNPNDAVENITLTVMGTDGTKMTYLWKAGAFRCSEIKDRNGNFITINHDAQGLLKSVTDTLGRVVNINYDSELYPTSITQTWKDNNGAGSNVTHTWATFTYTTKEINTNFASNISVFGPQNGTTLKVLQKIAFPNGSSTAFDYNGYGQVWKVRNIAADSSSHVLNYVRTNLETPSTNQTDCPRFTETRNWVENFNLNNQNVAQETVVSNSIQTNQSYSVGGVSGTATKIEVTMADHPYGAVSKTFVGSSGWMEGLPVATEDWANGTGGSERKRWTWTNWTQDNPNVSYILNPRAIESKVGDTTNIKRTTTEYRTYPNTTIAEFGLVKETAVYDTNQTTVLKKVVNEYKLDNAYLSRRIIGLPLLTETWGLNQQNNQFEKTSKVTFEYDEGDFSDTNLAQNVSSAIQHDNTNYSTGLMVGRGNLTSTTRHDVTGQTASVKSQVKYNTTGAPVAQTDPLSRTIKISYTDSFNDNQNHNTFAYPTKVYDPANNYSEVKYRFDIGANVWAKSPAPAGNTAGKETIRLYDSIGRLDKETLVNTGAYTRYEYPTNQVQSKVFSTVIDTNNNGADAADEVLAETWADGAGRVRKSRTEHPNSTGGWTGSLTEYDLLGQVKRATIPTEIDASYEPTGDDATRGWLWNQQEYDWKGRTKRIIPSDSDGTDGKDQLFSYDGCGCAGGQVTTIQSESVPRDDQSNVNARRVQRVYEDILGRSYKTEVLNWDGATVYTTTVQIFNGRDQITKTRQYAGNESATTYQDVTMTYDGHGRLKTRHYPIEDAQAATTLIYNADDTVQQSIDPRNAITNYTYDSRGLVTQVSYDPPANQTDIPDTPTVNYSYDDLGNVTQMIDGTGSTDYAYNQLSQLVSETKHINDFANQSFTNTYTYNLSGGLKSVTDAFNSTVNYTNDKTGRLTSVTGTAFGDNTTGNYADNIQYRAFGQIKQLNYKTDDNALVKMQYDNRLRASTYEVESNLAASGYLKKSTFSYNADSRPNFMNDVVNPGFNRSYKYDHVGRLKANTFGTSSLTPYSQTVTYDAFSQMTYRQSIHWNQENHFNSTFSNGRESTIGVSGRIYDSAGNITNSGTRGDNSYQMTVFDAANRRKEFLSQYKQRTGRYNYVTTKVKMVQDYDGAGNEVKQTEFVWDSQSQTWTQPQKHYQIWSSVLKSFITEVRQNGEKMKTRVFAGGALIAEQRRDTGANNTNIDKVEWIHSDPVSGSSQRTNKNGNPNERKEYEPLGNQSVNTNGDENDYPPPATQTEAMTRADDPSWMCQRVKGFNDDFSALPIPCQITAFNNNEVDIDNLHPKKTVIEININWTPKKHLPTSSSDQMLGYALKATAKTARDGEKNEEKRKDDKTIDAGQIGVVQSEKAIDPLVPDYIDVSVSNEFVEQTTVPIPDKDEIDCNQILLTQLNVIDGSSDPSNRNKKNIPYINSTIYPQFQAALDEINKNIGHIGFSEMYRDRARQQYLYDNKKKNSNPVAKPGTSNHEGGFAFDIPAKYRNLKTLEGETVEQIFIKHGFIKAVSGDEPHFAWKDRPTGAASLEINKKLDAWFLKCTNGY